MNRKDSDLFKAIPPKTWESAVCQMEQALVTLGRFPNAEEINEFRNGAAWNGIYLHPNWPALALASYLLNRITLNEYVLLLFYETCIDHCHTAQCLEQLASLQTNIDDKEGDLFQFKNKQVQQAIYAYNNWTGQQYTPPSATIRQDRFTSMISEIKKIQNEADCQDPLHSILPTIFQQCKNIQDLHRQEMDLRDQILKCKKTVPSDAIRERMNIVRLDTNPQEFVQILYQVTQPILTFYKDTASQEFANLLQQILQANNPEAFQLLQVRRTRPVENLFVQWWKDQWGEENKTMDYVPFFPQITGCPGKPQGKGAGFRFMVCLPSENEDVCWQVLPSPELMHRLLKIKVSQEAIIPSYHLTLLKKPKLSDPTKRPVLVFAPSLFATHRRLSAHNMPCDPLALTHHDFCYHLMLDNRNPDKEVWNDLAQYLKKTDKETIDNLLKNLKVSSSESVQRFITQKAMYKILDKELGSYFALSREEHPNFQHLFWETISGGALEQLVGSGRQGGIVSNGREVLGSLLIEFCKTRLASGFFATHHIYLPNNWESLLKQRYLRLDES